MTLPVDGKQREGNLGHCDSRLGSASLFHCLGPLPREWAENKAGGGVTKACSSPALGTKEFRERAEHGLPSWLRDSGGSVLGIHCSRLEPITLSVQSG